jgi:hypothetical protein
MAMNNFPRRMNAAPIPPAMAKRKLFLVIKKKASLAETQKL